MKKKRTYNRKKLTQRQVIMHKLITNRWYEGNKFIPVHEFMGEKYIKELGKWGYVSYECSARLSALVKENPGLIERVKIRGNSGAVYYGYRVHPQATGSKVVEPSVKYIYDQMCIFKKNGVLPKSQATISIQTPEGNLNGTVTEVEKVPDSKGQDLLEVSVVENVTVEKNKKEVKSDLPYNGNRVWFHFDKDDD